MQLRIVSAQQFDLCTVCGAYAELDDLEKIICYACTADVSNPTHTIEILAHYDQWHPNSATGQKITHYKVQLKLYNELADNQEAYVGKLQARINDSDFDLDGVNEYYELRDDLEQELDSATQELDSIYRTIGDMEAEMDAIHYGLPIAE